MSESNKGTNGNIMDFILKLTSYLVKILASKDGYITLFKGGIALAMLCILTTQYIFSQMIPIEANAYKLKYEVEQKLQIRFDSFDEMQCDLKTGTYAKCEIAKRHKELSSSSIDFLYSLFNVFSYLSLLMIAFSVLGFLSRPFIHDTEIEVS